MTSPLSSPDAQIPYAACGFVAIPSVLLSRKRLMKQTPTITVGRPARMGLCGTATAVPRVTNPSTLHLQHGAIHENAIACQGSRPDVVPGGRRHVAGLGQCRGLS